MAAFPGTRQILRLARRVHPARLRHDRVLRSLELDVDALPRPLAPLSDRDFIICGCPRTGTSFLAGALYQLPTIITSVEPWLGMRVPPAELFRTIRQDVETTRWLTHGTLDVPQLLCRGDIVRIPESAMKGPAPVEGDWWLGIKWPGYWRFAPLLPETRFLVCIRHPYEVIRSFERIGGALSRGLDYDTKFNRIMNDELRASTSDETLRRIRLFDWNHDRILPLLERPNVMAVRYERWFTEPDVLLDEVHEFLGAPRTATRVRPMRRSGAPTLAPHVADLIKRECRTAAALGYELD